MESIKLLDTIGNSVIFIKIIIKFIQNKILGGSEYQNSLKIKK
jgi:hypothetical protein